MKKIIFFQAHPDDLEFYCPHLLHYLAQKPEEYEIKIASMTRGEFSTPTHRDEQFKGIRLGKIREQELYRAHKVHGITPEQIHFFGILDQMVKLNKQTIELVRKYLEEEKPSIIFAPEPIYTYYRHPDHMTAGKLVYYVYDKLLVEGQPKLYYYGVFNSNFYWPYYKTAIEFAFKLMDLHKSQKFMMEYVKPLYRLLGRLYGINVKGWGYAEGYRRVFYGQDALKNKKLSILKKLFYFLLLSVWPKDLSKLVPIPDEYIKK